WAGVPSGSRRWKAGDERTSCGLLAVVGPGYLGRRLAGVRRDQLAGPVGVQPLQVASLGRPIAAAARQVDDQPPIGRYADRALAFMDRSLAAGRLDDDAPGRAVGAPAASACRVVASIEGCGRAVEGRPVARTDHDALCQSAAPRACAARVGQVFLVPEHERRL